MKFEPGNIYFNRIYIIQSLLDSEEKTGLQLYINLLTKISDQLTFEIKDVTNRAQLFDLLVLIKSEVQKGILPYIHFETHAYKEGLLLSDDSDIPWKELTPYLLEINHLTKNNLFVSMAACKGGNIQFGVKITEPCPFRGFIGPMEDVWNLDLLNSFKEFFDVLLAEDDFERAINALNSKAKGVKYHHMNAEAFFDVVMNYNNELEKNDPKILYDRVELLVQGELRRNPLILDRFGSVENLRKWTENFAMKNKPEMIEILKKRFCHIS